MTPLRCPHCGQSMSKNVFLFSCPDCGPSASNKYNNDEQTSAQTRKHESEMAMLEFLERKHKNHNI